MSVNDKLAAFAQEIESRIIDMIKQGTAPWLKPWKCNSVPCNPITGTSYTGLNLLNLINTTIYAGYDKPEYITFNQAKELEGSIKKGERASRILYHNLLEAKNPPKELDSRFIAIDDKVYRRVFSVHYVFNIDQCDRLNKDKLAEYREKHGFSIANKPAKEFQDNALLEAILRNSKIQITHTHMDRACYCPANDVITLPHKEHFNSPAQYYSTALHELGHATGHQSRLNRDLSGGFGTPMYAKEELRAELYSFMQAMELRIDYDLHNHASYVDSWINTLERDTKEIGRALKDCVKMVQYVKDNWYPQELKKQHSLENQATHTTTQSKESKSYVNSQANTSSTTKAVRK